MGEGVPQGGLGRGGGVRPLGGKSGEQDLGPLPQGLETVPALLPAARQHAAQQGESLRSLVRPRPPAIFWRTFLIRMARSARLFANGTAGSSRQRSTAC